MDRKRTRRLMAKANEAAVATKCKHKSKTRTINSRDGHGFLFETCDACESWRVSRSVLGGEARGPWSKFQGKLRPRADGFAIAPQVCR
jgi:hypothetical protein